MQPASEDRLRIILQRKYRSSGCFYCKGDAHSYHNCPVRPCYLCKRRGHIASHCPHRHRPSTSTPVSTDISTTASFTSPLSRSKPSSAFHYLRHRELIPTFLPKFSTPIHLRHRTSRLVFSATHHKKRITTADWSPDGTAIFSADKHGVIQVWPLSNAHSFHSLDVYHIPPSSDVLTCTPHRCNVNAFAFNNTSTLQSPSRLYSTSSDGTVVVTHLDVPPASSSTNALPSEIMLDLNPNGWQSMSTFRMAYGIAHDPARNSLYVGVDNGTLICLDPRDQAIGKQPSVRAKFHSGKITTVSVNPSRSDLIATASNDGFVRLWDARRLLPNHPLAGFDAKCVISSAYFSPCTGASLLATCMDNRIRLWRDVHSFGNALPDGNEENNAIGSKASQIEIVHSHNFNRYLSPFRAVWDPKDTTGDLFMCGRFLGEAFRERGESDDSATVLCPVDMFSAREGCVVHSLMDRGLTLKCPINKFSPVSDVVLTAASFHLYLWAPSNNVKKKKMKKGEKRSGGTRSCDGNSDSEDDDDDDDDNDAGNDDNDFEDGQSSGIKRRKNKYPKGNVLQLRRKKET